MTPDKIIEWQIGLVWMAIICGSRHPWRAFFLSVLFGLVTAG